MGLPSFMPGRKSDRDLAKLLMSQGHTVERVAYAFVARNMRDVLARVKPELSESEHSVVEWFEERLEAHFADTFGIQEKSDDSARDPDSGRA